MTLNSEIRHCVSIEDKSPSVVTHEIIGPGTQFYSLYNIRLSQLKDILLKSAKRKWGQGIAYKKLVDLTLDDVDECVIFGIIYKNQVNKPNVLKEFSEEFELPVSENQTKFTCDTDEIILEYEVRIRLVGQVDVGMLVTGMVVAVKGKQGAGGKFIVDDICFPAGNSIPKPIIQEDRYIVLASGLNISGGGMDAVLSLTSWITGWSDCDTNMGDVKSIVHLIFAGNVISSIKENTKSVITNTSIDVSADITLVLKQVDSLLSDVSMTIPTTLMPGISDPTNIVLPQRPIHHSMFALASQNENFHSASNPYRGITDGVHIVGTSGQNVDDLICNSTCSTSLDALELSLRCSLIGPTAPDTLPCFPSAKEDHLVLQEIPHIYFAGNQPEFQTRIIKLETGNGVAETLLVSIPKFEDTKSVVFINLRSLESHEISMAPLY